MNAAGDFLRRPIHQSRLPAGRQLIPHAMGLPLGSLASNLFRARRASLFDPPDVTTSAAGVLTMLLVRRQTLMDFAEKGFLTRRATK